MVTKYENDLVWGVIGGKEGRMLMKQRGVSHVLIEISHSAKKNFGERRTQ